MKARRPPVPADLEVFPELDAAWPEDGLGPVAVVVAQLPELAALPPGALVVVHGAAAPPSSLVARFFRRVPRRAHAAVRCTALLARGFTGIGAGVDPATREDLVWGSAPAGIAPSGRPPKLAT